MGNRIRSLILSLVFVLAACSGARGPVFATVASTIPPVAADRARIYFYRDYEPYESLARPELYLNRAPAGVSVPGGVFYRDVAPGTVLFVDDDELVRPAIAELLKCAGFQVFEAGSAPEAVRILTQKHVDVLFTDIVKPDLNGIELAIHAKRRVSE